jgi:hypothetical protein
MRTQIATVLAVMLVSLASPAPAQEAVHPGYPNVDRAIEIAAGESVHLLNRVLVDRVPGQRSVRRIDFAYRTTIPATDVDARAAQAGRAAQVLGAIAMDAGVRNIAIAICDSDACGRRDEPPRVWYLYELRAGNVWKLQKN